jgi:hypothetical protein
MNHDQAKKLIDEYTDGRLSSDNAAELKKHIDECRECSELASEIQSLLSKLRELPEKITPPHDLWRDVFHQIHDLKVIQIKKEEVEEVIEEEPDEEEEKQKEEVRKEIAKAREKKEMEEKRKEKNSKAARVYNFKEVFKKNKTVFGIAGAAILLIIAFFIITTVVGSASWEISGTSGTYRINNEDAAGSELNDGDILETLSSSAVVVIPEIGRIEVNPYSRIEKLGGRNLKLSKGSITVKLNSLEYLDVEVFSSEIQELEPDVNYRVQMNNDNTADLSISEGKIMVQGNNLKATVIPNFTCKINNSGPEIPVSLNASAALKTALKELSFGHDVSSLNTALNEAGLSDALSIWHLFERIRGDNIDEVYVKLYSLTPPPKGVDQESILRLKQEALTAWLNQILKLSL